MSNVLKGALWSLAGNAGAQLSAAVSLVLLARVLEPGEFGIVATAMVVVALVQTVVQDAFSEVLIRLPEVGRGHEAAVFVLSASVASASLLAVLLILLLGPGFLIPPSLGQFLLALMPLGLLSAVAAVPSALLKRTYRFRALACRSMISIFGGGCVGVGAAFLGGGAWSLVAQQWAQAVLQAVVLLALAGQRPSTSFSRGELAAVWSYGWKSFGLRSVLYGRQYLPRLVIAIYLGPAAVGLFQLAAKMAGILESILIFPIISALLPAAAQMQEDRDALASCLTATTKATAVVAVPCVLLAAITAQLWVPLLVGVKWLESVPAFQLLAAGVLANLPVAVNGTMMRAMNLAGWQLLVGVTTTLFMLVLAMILAPKGITYVAAAVLVVGVAGWPLQVLIFRWKTAVVVSKQHSELVPVAIAAVVASVSVFALYLLPLQGLHAVLRLPLECLMGTVSYVVTMLLLDRSSVLSYLGVVVRAGRSLSKA